MVEADPQESQLVFNASRAQQPEYFLDALQLAASVLGAEVVPPPARNEKEGILQEEEIMIAKPKGPPAALTYLPPNATKFEFARCLHPSYSPKRPHPC